MNCFEWQNQSSDYLDGILPPTIKREADEHLERCKSCTEHHQHYRLILTSIASQPRSALPVPIRKSPFHAALPKLDMARLGRSRWENLPWYVRTTLEGSGIVLLILLGISTGPKIRSFYERKVEKSLDEFSQSFNDTGSETPDGPSATGSPSANTQLSRGRLGEPAEGADSAAAKAEDFGANSEGGDADEDEDDPTVDMGPAVADEDVYVGKSEIWRFMIKTDSPRETRAKVVSMLEGLKLPPATPGLGGVEAPGGIQFDLLLPQGVVATIKHQLQAIAPLPPKNLANTALGETFTWYKNKSKREIPAGRTRVVIWLSQM